MGSALSSPSKPSIQEILQYCSNEIIPSSDYIHDGNTTANEVFNILRSQRKDVDRVIVAGSIGKKTAVGDGSDFDLVIFLNNKEPPFDCVLSEIRKELDNQKSKLKNYKFLNQTDMVISFEAHDYQFDLSPAANFKGWLTSQKDATLDKIQALPNPVNNGRLFSPGLAESAVEFLKHQSSFTHSVIRLAKYWNSQVNLDRIYIGGRSLMMELLAIKACEKVTKNDIYLAFKQFLTDVKEFEEQTVYFHNKSEIPSEILNYDGPVILDPVNMYNNLGNRENIPREAVAIFQEAATKSLNGLERWVQDPNATVESFKTMEIFGANVESYDSNYEDTTDCTDQDADDD